MAVVREKTSSGLYLLRHLLRVALIELIMDIQCQIRLPFWFRAEETRLRL